MGTQNRENTINSTLVALTCTLSALLVACPEVTEKQPDSPTKLAQDTGVEPDPRFPGPFAVGNVTRQFRNPEHWKLGDCRFPANLNVEIWYPAVHDEGAPPQRLRDFLNGWDVLTLLFRLVARKDYQNFDQILASQRDAQPDLSGAPYPVVMFSHGAGGIRFQNWTMAEYLAGHGFVVLAPDHTGDALFSTLDHRIVLVKPMMLNRGNIDRVSDISFLLDEMERLTQGDPENLLTGLVDPARAGIIGHSLGGPTVGKVLEQDSRFLAGFSVSGPQMEDPPPTDFEAPIFYLYGVEDRNLSEPPYVVGECYERSNPPKYRIDCFDAGHYSFSDACRIVPSIVGYGDGCGEGHRLETGQPFEFISYKDAHAILDSYLTAFMGSYLCGYASHAEYLLDNHFPEEIAYTYELGS
jgi:dienelactone hydrolase